MHEATEYVTRSSATVPTIVHENELPTATLSLTERVDNLLQLNVDNERRKRNACGSQSD
jgi:hypothetical protein